MRILEPEQENTIKKNYLHHVGSIIRRRRERVNLSQEDLSTALHISRSTLSVYENGGGDMSVALLPLISIYCKFPMSDYNDVSMDHMVSAFSSVAEVTRRKYQRSQLRENYKSRRRLKAYIYEEDGMDTVEYLSRKKKGKTMREKLACGEIEFPDVKPFSTDEFGDFLVDERNNGVGMLGAAGVMLDYLSDIPHKETVRACICDFVIGNVIVEPLIQDDSETNRRAYMYYRSLIQNKLARRSGE